VLNPVEIEPPRRPARGAATTHRPRAGTVVCIARFGHPVIVTIEGGMIGHSIGIEVGQAIVECAVAIEIHSDTVQFAVTVDIEVKVSRPDRRCAVTGIEAVIHSRFDARRSPVVPA
jgi:hypothetical protein